MYNTQGQLARQLKPMLNTDYELTLDLSDLAGGLYTLEMYSDVLLSGVRRLWKVVLWGLLFLCAFNFTLLLLLVFQ
jgi:hypothetical protein